MYVCTLCEHVEGAQAALIRTYVARVLMPEERMKLVGILSSLAGVAYAGGPGNYHFISILHFQYSTSSLKSLSLNLQLV